MGVQGVLTVNDEARSAQQATRLGMRREVWFLQMNDQ